MRYSKTRLQRNIPIDLWLLFILIVSAILLFYDLGGRALWWDEIINIYIEQQPIPLIFASLSDTPDVYHDIHPPLYHLIMHYWIKYVGTSDFAMRFPSAVFGLISVGMVYAIGQALHSRLLGRVAAYLTAIAPGGIMYLRMGRYYAFTCLLGLLSTWLFIKLWRSPQRWLWLSYLIAALALYYTDYLGVGVLGGHVIFALWYGRHENRGKLFRFLGLHLLIVLAYLPWIPFVFAQVGWASGVVQADLAFSPVGYLLKFLFPFISFTAGETLFPWHPPALITYLIFGILLIQGTIYSPLEVRYRNFLLIIFLVSLLGTVLIISVVLPTIPFIGVPNRTLFALPFLNLLAATGWMALSNFRRRILTLGIITVVALIGNINYFKGVDFFNPIYAVPTEDLVEFIVKNSSPGDVIMSTEDIGLAYYLQSQGIDIPHYWSYRTQANSILEKGDAPRIWWLTYGRDRTRVDDMVEAYRAQLAEKGYELIMQQGYVPQHPSYRWMKEKLLGREAYQYKVTINLYARE